MSGKSRTAFHAVPRIIKVGNENEPPSCLKWKDLLFANDVDMTSEANPDEAIVPDMNVEIPDVLEETSIVSHRTCGSSKEQSEKALCQESCDNEINSEFGNVSINGEDCKCNEISFCEKYMKTFTSEKWRPFEKYISKTRINVNIRQVHEKGKTMNSFCQ